MSETRTSLEDVADGIEGVVRMVGAFLTPGHRHARSIWGATDEEAGKTWPGDEIVPRPRWWWHHAIDIASPADEVWPWVVQIGADRAGFYSYEALENVAGCQVHNADRVHPEWQQIRVGDGLRLHPKMPPLPIVWVDAGRGFAAGTRVAAGTNRLIPVDHPVPDEHLAASWFFGVVPLAGDRSQFVSRYRVSYGDDLATRVSMGPVVVEPIGTVMDERMLEGVRERVERARRLRNDPLMDARDPHRHDQRC